MEQYFSEENIIELEKNYKTNLINSISGFKSANLLGTISSEGITNLSIISSVVHIGADPALMGFILRPTTVPRNSYDNLLENKSFTINQVSKYIVGKAHFTSAKFTAEESEFSELQLDEEYIENCAAPFVKESKLKIGLKYDSEHVLSNGCRLIIGKIQHLSVSKSALNKNGSLNLDTIDAVSVSGLNKYYTSDFLKEYPYARKENIKQHLTKKQKERPDNVVFNAVTKSYDASLKRYSTNVGAPLIVHNDLGNWKRIGSNKVNNHLKSQYEDVKNQYTKILEVYEWNQKIYDSKFNFEPNMGMIYHLYQNKDNTCFLSIIGPQEWNKAHLGSFKLNADRIFIKI
jgi:flavin reductase (DIM6/NTAB) family NADH-FMN oxidoreductase RutF